MPACLLYVIFWSEALKGWIHTVYWKCLHRSQVTARTATEQQPEQSSHNRKPVLNRPAPLMVIHSAGKHTEKLFRLCYNPATGSRRWCKIGRGRKTGREYRRKTRGTREMASDLTQEQFMFPSWPGTNYVHTLQKPSGCVKAINNAQRCIDDHVHARAQTVHCVPLGRQCVRRTLSSVVLNTSPAYRRAGEHKHTLSELFIQQFSS